MCDLARPQRWESSSEPGWVFLFLTSGGEKQRGLKTCGKENVAKRLQTIVITTSKYLSSSPAFICQAIPEQTHSDSHPNTHFIADIPVYCLCLWFFAAESVSHRQTQHREDGQRTEAKAATWRPKNFFSFFIQIPRTRFKIPYA